MFFCFYYFEQNKKLSRIVFCIVLTLFISLPLAAFVSCIRFQLCIMYNHLRLGYYLFFNITTTECLNYSFLYYLLKRLTLELFNIVTEKHLFIGSNEQLGGMI